MSDEQATRLNEWALYRELAAPFERTHFRDGGGGAKLEYIDGEQCVTRLNEKLGFLNWSFTVVTHGIHAEADEIWVMGEISVTIDGRTVTRQQFGSQKIKRSRSSGTPMDLGFDLKGATTDALKKCATLIGVALYLYEKEAPSDRVTTPGNAPGGSGAKPTPISGPGGSSTGAGSSDLDSLTCQECGEPLTETRFKDGTVWSLDQLAVFGRRKHSRILCMLHYREANNAKRRAEEALQQVPF
jgi:hypothetical protein